MFELAGGKHGRPTFVHERLNWTLCSQSPSSSDTEWLGMHLDGYKIIKIYKPPPTRLQTSDQPVFPHPRVYGGEINSPHSDWGYKNSGAEGDSMVTRTNSNNRAFFYNPNDTTSYHSGRWNAGANPILLFCSIGSHSRLHHKRVLEKFPSSQHRPLLFIPP